MYKRIIPSLLIKDGNLVKGKRFKNHKYVGDPINAVRIFNEKEVDEIQFLDIDASKNNSGPNFELISELCAETFMPFSYGGGITTLAQIEKLFSLGVEKVVLNTSAFLNPTFVSEAVKISGSASIVISIDYKYDFFNKCKVYIKSGNSKTNMCPLTYAKMVEDLGVGEIVLCNIDKEGMKKGYDFLMAKKICNSVGLPVIVSGGAGNIDDMLNVIDKCGASAASAGSLFVFHGDYDAVLITYPNLNDF